MKYILCFHIVLLGYVCSVTAQSGTPVHEGEVSFITTKSIYVKFESTSTIAIGDTLTLKKNRAACLVVINKSTTSVVCTTIADCTVEKNDVVLHSAVSNVTNPEKEIVKEVVEPKQVVVKEPEEKSLYSQNISGRLSLSTYSTLSNIREDRHRLMSRFSMNAQHINDSKFSFNSYLNYRKNILKEDATTFRPNEYLRVYSLSVSYDATPSLSLTAGRSINPKMSSVGAIDGLQVEKYFGTSFVGVVAGFRPDIYDFNFNSKLLQYGGYIGKEMNTKYISSETTLGFIEQKNDTEIDRRYTFLQHRSSFLNKFYLFGTAELDLFNQLNGQSFQDLRLTNLYASLRYRYNRNFDITLSFDSRKRIIYYETFQSEIERLLDDDIARQGARVRVNIRPMDDIQMGFGYGKRFQSDQQNKSDNINGYFGLTKIPGVGGRLSLNFNVNSSNYLNSNIITVRHSRTLLKNKLEGDFYYRFADYSYTDNQIDLKQHYYGANLSLRISRRLAFSVTGEYSMYGDEENFRIYTRLIKRFYSKRKK